MSSRPSLEWDLIFLGQFCTERLDCHSGSDTQYYERIVPQIKHLWAKCNNFKTSWMMLYSVFFDVASFFLWCKNFYNKFAVFKDLWPCVCLTVTFFVKFNSFPFLNEVNNIADINKLRKDALVTFFFCLCTELVQIFPFCFVRDLNIFFSLVAEAYSFSLYLM